MKVIIVNNCGHYIMLSMKASDTTQKLREKFSIQMNYKYNEQLRLSYNGKIVKEDQTLKSQFIKNESVLVLMRLKSKF
jgi:hypothetical protein